MYILACWWPRWPVWFTDRCSKVSSMVILHIEQCADLWECLPEDLHMFLYIYMYVYIYIHIYICMYIYVSSCTITNHSSNCSHFWFGFAFSIVHEETMSDAFVNHNKHRFRLLWPPFLCGFVFSNPREHEKTVSDEFVYNKQTLVQIVANLILVRVRVFQSKGTWGDYVRYVQ